MNSMRAWLFSSTDALSFLGYSARAFSNVCWDLVDRCGWSCGYEDVSDGSLSGWVGYCTVPWKGIPLLLKSL